ncbi:hypothetical protein KBTX_03717 [wastewater metagenome]|uniref:Uncharacterized protein n=2 Tax=unclassified sequences TaxID=12908 RepID=A0A5B8RKD1_9ZZZZ|nr:hypothetical protein KBTEX_03717 [uncultured organism]
MAGLVLGTHARAHLADGRAIRDRPGRAGLIAGEHHHPQAQPAQPGHRVPGLGTQRCRQRQRTGQDPVGGDEQRRAALVQELQTAFAERVVYSRRGQRPVCPDDHVAAVDAATQRTAGQALDVLGHPGPDAALLCGPAHRPGTFTGLHRRRPAEDVADGDPVDGLDGDHLGGRGRERAGLVQGDHRKSREGVQDVRLAGDHAELHQAYEPGIQGEGHGQGHRGRRREHQQHARRQQGLPGGPVEQPPAGQ